MSDEGNPTHFEPLSAMDRQFLFMEAGHTYLHVAGFTLFETGPLRAPSGGVDFAAFRVGIEGVLHKIPRYRQKLIETPIQGRPVWVDDADFDLDLHLRHLALPTPGSEDLLKEMIGWIVSQPLDMSRPLWEMWLIEGVEDGRYFSIVTKMHHCMIDGGAGVNLMQLLMRATPEFDARPPQPYVPRPAPSRTELAAWEIGRRASLPLRMLSSLRRYGSDTSHPVDDVAERIESLRTLLQNVLPASATPINGEHSPRRRVDWLDVPLERLLVLRKNLGCPLNDVVLAIVAGALSRYLPRRGVDLEGLDFRVSIPVNIRRESEAEEINNRVSTWIVPLPLAEPDPLTQLELISSRTGQLKKTHQANALEMMMTAAEEIPAILSFTSWAMKGQINMVVTNIPGPPIPLYMMGCRALNMQPLVPLLPDIGIGIALLSYDGTLFWGFQADYDLVPDLDAFVRDIEDSLGTLERAAGVSRHVDEPPRSSAGHPIASRAPTEPAEPIEDDPAPADAS